MDIGAGNGIISRSIGKNLCGQTLNWDLVDAGYSSQETGPDEKDASIVLYRSIPSGKLYDIIIAVDVVEHVKEDRQFVELLSRHLAPNGLLLISVPAFQFLWSKHDIFLEHYRRYRIKSLALLISSCGVSVLKSSYLYVFLFPLIVIVRLSRHIDRKKMAHGHLAPVSDLKVYPNVINSSLRALMSLEYHLTRRLPCLGLFFGLSCLVIGRKRTAATWGMCE